MIKRMTLNNAQKSWKTRYFQPKFIDEYCEFCNEQLTTKYYLDITGLKFCNRSCFKATESFRDSVIFKFQKEHDSKFYNHRLDLKQKGR